MVSKKPDKSDKSPRKRKASKDGDDVYPSKAVGNHTEKKAREKDSKDKNKDKDGDGDIKRRKVEKGDGTVDICKLCKANAKDSVFAKEKGLPDAPGSLCQNCYALWIPAKPFCDFGTFVQRYEDDEEFHREVESARRLQARCSSSCLPKDRCAVVAESRLVVRLKRAGVFLREEKMKSETFQSTQKQLRLDDPMEIDVLNGDDKVL